MVNVLQPVTIWQELGLLLANLMLKQEDQATTTPLARLQNPIEMASVRSTYSSFKGNLNNYTLASCRRKIYLDTDNFREHEVSSSRL
jgi:hypothetical protein